MTKSMTDLEEKRARQRVHVKRSYYRQLSKLQSMRDEVAELKLQYDRLVQQQDADASISSSRKPSASTIDQYKSLSQLREHLREENARLQEYLQAHTKAQQKFERFLQKENESKNASSGEPSEHKIDFDWETITLQEASQLSSACYARLQACLRPDLCATTGASMLGWKEQRSANSRFLNFSLTKLFKNQSAAHLADLTWQIFQDPSRHRALYSPSLRLTHYTLEHLDENNFIQYRVIEMPDRTVAIKSLNLLSKVERDGQTITMFQSMNDKCHPKTTQDAGAASPPKTLVQVAQKEVWEEVCSWVCFAPTDEEGGGCRLHFGGVSGDPQPSQRNLWMLEVLLIALRWETAVIGPVFSIGSDETSS